MDTRRKVRIPAGLPRTWRSRPINTLSASATTRRAVASRYSMGIWSVGSHTEDRRPRAPRRKSGGRMIDAPRPAHRHYQLVPMDLAESAQYLRHHLALVGRTDTLVAGDAIARLHKASLGLPRPLHNAAIAALIAAVFAGKALRIMRAQRKPSPNSPATDRRSSRYAKRACVFKRPLAHYAFSAAATARTAALGDPVGSSVIAYRLGGHRAALCPAHHRRVCGSHHCARRDSAPAATLLEVVVAVV